MRVDVSARVRVDEKVVEKVDLRKNKTWRSDRKNGGAKGRKESNECLKLSKG